VTADASTAAPVPESPPRRDAGWQTLLYPAAFPLSIIVLVWGESEINLLEIVRPVVVALVVTVGLNVLLGWLAGDRRLGAIATSALMIGLIVDRPEARILLVVVAGAVVLIGYLPQGRTLRVAATATRLLEVIGTIALGAALLYVAGRPGFLSVIGEAFLAPPGPASRPMPPRGTPDIVVYLIDGYPGLTAATRLPGIDATTFPAALRERGFTVHADARTNYLITRIVLASMLEGRHIADIPTLAAPFGDDPAVDARRLRSVQETSAGLAAIRGAGYDVVWVSSAWSHLDIRNVDRRIEAPGPSEFEMVLFRETAIADVLEAIDPAGFADVMRTRIEAAFDEVPAIEAEPHDRPRFIFVHVPAPHPPPVYTATGAPEDRSPDSSWNTFDPASQAPSQRVALRPGFVETIGRMTVESVDALRSAARTPPVIVVFSDHGTDVGWDDSAPMTSDLAERSSSFLATVTPGHPDLFHEPTTPVNIIGTLTNAYMGTAVPRQPDETFAYDGSVLNVVPIQTTPGD
jgi:hypothetical protein